MFCSHILFRYVINNWNWYFLGVTGICICNWCGIDIMSLNRRRKSSYQCDTPSNTTQTCRMPSRRRRSARQALSPKTMSNDHNTLVGKINCRRIVQHVQHCPALSCVVLACQCCPVHSLFSCIGYGCGHPG